LSVKRSDIIGLPTFFARISRRRKAGDPLCRDANGRLCAAARLGIVLENVDVHARTKAVEDLRLRYYEFAQRAGSIDATPFSQQSMIAACHDIYRRDG
jgi:hypothetical protein